MEVLHVIVMFLGILLVVGWMLGVCDSLLHGRFLNWLCKKNWMVVPVGIITIAFVARIWFVIVLDVQDIVNYIFGLLGCSPIDIKNFG